METLTAEQVDSRLNALDDWMLENGKLHKEFSFPNFTEALAFVNRIGAIAEELNHHPEVWFTWGMVRVEIITHDAGGLTEKDFELARTIRRA